MTSLTHNYDIINNHMHNYYIIYHTHVIHQSPDSVHSLTFYVKNSFACSYLGAGRRWLDSPGKYPPVWTSQHSCGNGNQWSQENPFHETTILCRWPTYGSIKFGYLATITRLHAMVRAPGNTILISYIRSPC